MLDQALVFVKDLLDAHLRRRLGSSNSIVVLNHLDGKDSSQAMKNQNQLVMTLVQLEYETSKGFYTTPANASVRKNPPQRFNLNVLMSANFDDYIETLKVLSETILFFQATPALQASEYPHMPPGLTALQFEVENSPEARAFDMWNVLGARYMPSVLYKIRHVTMDASQIAGLSTPAGHIDVELGHE